MSFTAALPLAIIEPESGAALNTEKEHDNHETSTWENPETPAAGTGHHPGGAGGSPRRLLPVHLPLGARSFP